MRSAGRRTTTGIRTGRLDSNELCHDVLSRRQPQLDVRYLENPAYGHVDTFIGRGAALDVFGHIVGFLDDTGSQNRGVSPGAGSSSRRHKRLAIGWPWQMPRASSRPPLFKNRGLAPVLVDA
jgi:hypothetical protein